MKDHKEPVRQVSQEHLPKDIVVEVLFGRTHGSLLQIYRLLGYIGYV